MTVFRSFVFACAMALPLTAQAQAPHLSEIVEATMRPGWKTEAGTHMAALHLKLARDWITYWRHPGESGIAPQLDWSASQNLQGARILWPEPRLYIKAGFASIGYSNEIVLPIELTPARHGEPVKLDATLSLGVCSDICIPVDLTLQMALDGAGAHDDAIAAALSTRPRAARTAGLNGVECTISPHKRGVQLSASLKMPQSGEVEFVLVEMAGSTLPARALPTQREGDVLTGHTLFRTSGGGSIDRSAVRLSVVSEHGTFVHQGCALSD